MPRRQKTCIKILYRDLKLSGAVLVDHLYVIRAHFLDRPAHAIHTIIVRSDDKRAKLTAGNLAVFSPGSNCQRLSSIFQITGCRPACRLGIKTLIHSGI